MLWMRWGMVGKGLGKRDANTTSVRDGPRSILYIALEIPHPVPQPENKKAIAQLPCSSSIQTVRSLPLHYSWPRSSPAFASSCKSNPPATITSTTHKTRNTVRRLPPLLPRSSCRISAVRLPAVYIYIERSGRKEREKKVMESPPTSGGASRGRPRSKFICGIDNCDKSFIRREHLDRHRWNHCYHPDFACKMCRAHFRRPDLLGKGVFSLSLTLPAEEIMKY